MLPPTCPLFLPGPAFSALHAAGQPGQQVVYWAGLGCLLTSCCWIVISFWEGPSPFVTLLPVHAGSNGCS